MKKMKGMFALLAAAVVLMMLPYIAAAQAEQGSFDLGEMVITATKKATPVEKVSESVVVVTRDELDAMPYSNVDDLVASFAGIMTERTGTNSDHAGGLSIRGQDSSSGRVLVLVDGMILNNGDSGSANFDTIDMNNVERIEVIRGASSLVYGTNALGGIVNIIMKKPDTKAWKVTTTVEGGSMETYSEKINVSGGGDIMDVTLSVSNKRSGGYNSTLPEDRDSTDQGGENTFMKERAYSLKAVQGVGGSDSTLTYYAGIYDDERHRGQMYRPDLNPEGAAWSFDSQRFQFDYSNPGTRYSARFSAGYNLENYENYSERYRNNKYTLWIVGADRMNYGADGNLSWTRGRHDVAVGAGYSVASQDSLDDYQYSNNTDVRNDPDFDAFNRGDLDTTYVYAMDSVMLTEKTEMQFGLRFDDAKVEGAEYKLSGSTQTVVLDGEGWDQLSPKLGFIFYTGENTRMRVQYNHAFHAPLLESMTLNMYRSGNKFWHSNPDLEPEITDAYEIGFEHSGKRYAHTLNLFYNDVSDYIDIMDCSAGMGCNAPDRKYMNVGKVEIKGVEFETSLQTTSTTKLYFNMTYTDTSIEEYISDTSLVGKQLAEVPELIANVGATYSRKDDESLGLNMRYVGPRYYDSANTAGIKAYWTADVSASKWVTDQDKVYMTVNNILRPRLSETDDDPDRLPGIIWVLGVSRDL